MDFLDSLIPALPASGGMVTHNELMGRPRITFSSSPSPSPDPLSLQRSSSHSAVLHREDDTPPPPPPKSEKPPKSISTLHLPLPRGDKAARTAEGSHLTRSGAMGLPQPGDLGKRPGYIRRSSSFDDRRNAAGSEKKGHLRSFSTSSSGDRPVSSKRGQVPVALESKSRRMSFVETFKAMGRSERHSGSAGQGGKLTRGHERRSSDSTVGSMSSHHRQHSSTMPLPPRASSLIPIGLEGCIKLATNPSLLQPSHTLSKLLDAIPPTRIQPSGIPPPSSGILHPSSLIIPLTIILEALVVERTILRDEYKGDLPRLPVLRDGTSLQLKTQGELDWRTMRDYMLAIGESVESILPYLQEARESRKEVESLTRNTRMYVAKAKKVFGEVAAMYVDGYGFTRGWWDESGMKGAAGEVGRWGNIFDA